MDTDFFNDFRGAIFGGLALAVAVVPGVRMPVLRGRGAERGTRSPVGARTLAGVTR